MEPGELQGRGWGLGRVLGDWARCWENVLGSPERGLGEGRTGGGEGEGGGGRPGERGVSRSWGSGGRLEAVPAESQSLDRDAGGAAGRGSHTQTTGSSRGAAQGTHRPTPTHHPRPGVSSLARPAFQVSSPGVYHLPQTQSPRRREQGEGERAPRSGEAEAPAGCCWDGVDGPVGWLGPPVQVCMSLSVSECE